MLTLGRPTSGRSTGKLTPWGTGATFVHGPQDPLPNGLSQVASWHCHPHKCPQPHKLGSWRIAHIGAWSPSTPPTQACLRRQDPQPCCNGRDALCPVLAGGPACQVGHCISLECLGPLRGESSVGCPCLPGWGARSLGKSLELGRERH